MAMPIGVQVIISPTHEIKQTEGGPMSYQYNDDTFNCHSKEQLQDFLTATRALLKLVSRKTFSDGNIIYTNGRRSFYFNEVHGICNILEETTKILTGERRAMGVRSVLRYCFERWSSFSGNYSYPIPVTPDLRSRYDADDYERVYDYVNHWEGEQLASRKDLLIHIIETTNEFIKLK